ncbi:GTP-binding protein Era [Sulfurimonas gotlandica GD1]|jgi:GTP-binding protein Era|uniref:GTPase Era n=1 Tax=Sulfurimonas gotlandica (strain DSM 19862 / JCM 16533 / GD1) TaxID=929558 RepID=B6BMQ9_SULGG|nr:GTPase Era [Sulfurimonas gotlandica]EDZ61633.1 GTP-binding protein Era [Sulfurimonas gotlandica GD1]EHP30824.1 GTP-binding protein Era [Sulfurimonas gotlandica GD1]
MTKAGFVSLIGRPNAGKSTLMNSLLGENIAMVSQKANATRKRSNAIVMHEDTQIIFVDTPGLHEREKLLNQFMLDEALKAMGDCDLIVYLAPVTDSIEHYEKFLKLNNSKVKHIIVLSKIDQVNQDKLFKRIASYNQFSDYFEALIPVAIPKKVGHEDLLKTISKNLPESPFLYDPEDLTSELVRDIYAGFIREGIFENVSDEIPYESDVLIDSIKEEEGIDKIYATIIIEKESQKGIIIGKGGESIKRIGKSAREKVERLSGKKAFLSLQVSVKKGWSKDKAFLEEIGYKS